MAVNETQASSSAQEPAAGGSPVVRPGSWSPRLAGITLLLVLVAETAFITFAYPLNASVQISQAFKTNQAAWLQTAYALTAAVSAASIGKLADRYGKRRVILAVLLVVVVGSFISAFAPNFTVVILGRLLQAPALCLPFLLPSLIRDVFPTRTVPLAVSLATGGSGVFSIAASFAVGPVLAGPGFRATFWIPGVFALVLAVLVLAFVPEAGVRSRSRIDWTGATLLGLGVAGVLLGISLGPTSGWASLTTLGLIVGGLVVLGAWLAQALRVSEPLLDLRQLRQFPFMVTMILAAVGFNAVSFFYVLMPQVVLNAQPGWGLGAQPETLGIFAATFSLGTFSLAVVTGQLMSRLSGPVMCILAMTVVVIAFLVAMVGLQSSAVFAIATFLGGAIGGAVYAVAYNMVILLTPPERQATTSAAVTLVGNVSAAVVPVLVFAAMNSLMATDPTTGTPVYSSAAMHVATLAGAATGLIGIAFSAALLVSLRRKGVALVGGQYS